MADQGPRCWRGTKRKEMDDAVAALTKGRKSLLIKFDDDLREFYRQRVDEGDSFPKASRIAHSLAYERLEAQLEAEGKNVDPKKEFQAVPFENLAAPDYVRDYIWVLEMLGRDNVTKPLAPSGNAWNIYRFAKSGDDGLKKVMDWGMKLAPVKVAEEDAPEEKASEEGLDAMLGK